LSIAQGILRAHGGEIGVVSPPGQGATFALTFPLRAPEPDGAPPATGRYEA
jgi:signal transduction histidine kinase